MTRFLLTILCGDAPPQTVTPQLPSVATALSVLGASELALLLRQLGDDAPPPAAGMAIALRERVIAALRDAGVATDAALTLPEAMRIAAGARVKRFAETFGLRHLTVSDDGSSVTLRDVGIWAVPTDLEHMWTTLIARFCSSKMRPSFDRAQKRVYAINMGLGWEESPQYLVRPGSNRTLSGTFGSCLMV